MVRANLHDPGWVHRHRWATLSVLCVSLLVIILDNTILNIALPTLAKPVSDGGLGASVSELQWVVDAYTIVFAGLLLTAGSLGDRFGRYRGLVIGLSVFGTGSLLSAFATSATMLIATRAFMGVGGAFIMPSTLSILTNVFTEPRERGQGHRGVGGCGRPGRARSARWRHPAQPLLVGIGVPGQRPHRGGGPGRRLLPGARFPRPVASPARPPGGALLYRRPRHPALGGHRGTRPRVDVDQHPGGVRGRRHTSHRPSGVGAHLPEPHARHAVLPQSALRPPAAPSP